MYFSFMLKILYIIFLSLIVANCAIKPVVRHHGVPFLEKKQTSLLINKTNKNDILKILGNPSTKSKFDNDVYIYIERKTSSSRLSKLGKKKLIANNVLVLEINNRGVLLSKKFYDLNDLNEIKFDKDETGVNYSKKSFINNFLSGVREKIDDPLGKKRIKN